MNKKTEIKAIELNMPVSGELWRDLCSRLGSEDEARAFLAVRGGVLVECCARPDGEISRAFRGGDCPELCSRVVLLGLESNGVHVKKEKVGGGSMELEQLQSVENLHAFCGRVLGHAGRRGSAVVYPCPFGTHSKPHLEVVEFRGKGRWKCWACDRSGDIFDLYAALNGVDVKGRFHEAVEGVCGVLGISYREEWTTPRKARKNARAGASRRRVKKAAPVEEEDLPPAPFFLGADNAAALDECRERLRNDRGLARELLGELGLSVWLAAVCTEPGTGLPLIGATEDRRLVYLYSAPDEAGRLRLTGAKLRRRDGMKNARLRLEGGAWKEYGLMDAPPDDLKGGARFVSLCGKCCHPWGMGAARDRQTVIITEGESDCLAMVEAVEWFRETYGLDPETGEPCETEAGSFEAMLPAVVAVPGVSGFRRGWASLFSGKNVIVAMDGDEAGRKAASALMEALAGVGAVRNWTPPEEYKDVRTMLLSAGPRALCEAVFSVMNNTGERK